MRRKEDKKREHDRALFADHIESQLRRLGEKEEWRDHRYAELEAELEIFGRQQLVPLLKSLSPRRSLLTRVASLSVALERSSERLVILEGEPGAGKSVALRHLAQRLARRVIENPQKHRLIPIYINFKDFRPAERPVRSSHIHDFILEQLNQARSRDIERFLEREFDLGTRDGSWIFLFDSFDEIPDVLTAVEAGKIVEEYADAIYDFFHDLNACRGIVATRDFRGPKRFGWPKFEIVPLSLKRRRELIRKANLPRESESELTAGLSSLEPAISQLSENPLFLGLLCEHMREGNPLPHSAHIVLESFVTHRLNRDSDLVWKRFQISPDELRIGAQEIAFSIASESGLGLSPLKSELISTVCSRTMLSPHRLSRIMSALEYIKICKLTEADDTEDSRISFAHRRIQEYFATVVILGNQVRTSSEELLQNGRWRETSVTILQSQEASTYEPLLREASRIVENFVEGLSLRIRGGHRCAFDWPDGSLHVLQILATGTIGNPQALHEDTRKNIGRVLRAAWDTGLLHDQKWAIDLTAGADHDTSIYILEDSFEGASSWLQEAAYRSLSSMPSLAGELHLGLLRGLVGMSGGGRLRRERRTVSAQIKRLPNYSPFQQTFWLLTWLPFLDFLLHLVYAIVVDKMGAPKKDLFLVLLSWLLVFDVRNCASFSELQPSFRTPLLYVSRLFGLQYLTIAGVGATFLRFSLLTIAIEGDLSGSLNWRDLPCLLVATWSPAILAFGFWGKNLTIALWISLPLWAPIAALVIAGALVSLVVESAFKGLSKQLRYGRISMTTASSIGQSLLPAVRSLTRPRSILRVMVPLTLGAATWLTVKFTGSWFNAIIFQPLKPYLPVVEGVSILGVIFGFSPFAGSKRTDRKAIKRMTGRRGDPAPPQELINLLPDMKTNYGVKLVLALLHSHSRSIAGDVRDELIQVLESASKWHGAQENLLLTRENLDELARLIAVTRSFP